MPRKRQRRARATSTRPRSRPASSARLRSQREKAFVQPAHPLDVLIRKVGIAYLQAAASDAKDRARFVAGLVRYVGACQLRERKSFHELLLGDDWQPDDVPFVLPPRDGRHWKKLDLDAVSRLEVRARYAEELPRAQEDLRDPRARKRLDIGRGESAHDLALRRTAEAIGRSEAHTRSLLRERLTPDKLAALEIARGVLPSPEARRRLAVERLAECILALTGAPRTPKTRREALQQADSGSYPPTDEAPPPP